MAKDKRFILETLNSINLFPLTMSTKKTMFTIVLRAQSVSKSTDLKTAISYGVTIAVNMRAMTVTLVQIIVKAQGIIYNRRKTKERSNNKPKILHTRPSRQVSLCQVK